LLFAGGSFYLTSGPHAYEYATEYPQLVLTEKFKNIQKKDYLFVSFGILRNCLDLSFKNLPVSHSII